MKARFNTTGTHVRDGVLKVRIDLYPDPADKTYTWHHVLDEETGGMKVNPCLCHFIGVDEDITPAGLEALVQAVFGSGTRQVLDDALDIIAADRGRSSAEEFAARNVLAQTMRGKIGIAPVVAGVVEEILAAVNDRFKDFEVQL